MNAYLVAIKRSAMGKAKKGGFRFTRPDDLAVHVIKQLLKDVPNLDPKRVDDLLVGNALPEAEQGLNVARYIGLMALGTEVPAATVNRYCASGLETIAMGAAKIHAGIHDVVIAGGTESMSLVPMGGYKIVPNYTIARENPDWYFGMGHTAEAVAQQFDVNREDCDAFALRSHQRAAAAIAEGRFKDEIVPIEVEEVYYDPQEGKKKQRTYTVDTDEGVRQDTTLQALARLRPAFIKNGVVTAGNSSQTTDGASFAIIVSEKVLNELNLTPVAQLIGYGISGVEPRIMGIGPVEAVPKALKTAGKSLSDVSVIELNEAFATQSLAVMRKLDLDPDIVNPNGGAIALGHPLGCSGCALTAKMVSEVQRRGGHYGIVTACVGGGQGIAGVFEVFHN